MTGFGLPGAPAFVLAPQMMVPVDGVDVLVRAATVDQLAQVMGSSAALFEAWFALLPERRERLMAGSPSAEDLDVLLHLLQGHTGVPADLVATLLGQPRAWVGGLLPDRFVYLFACVVLVNADFFSQAGGMAAAVGELFAKARQAVAGSAKGPSGPISSTPSLQPGMPTAT